MTPEFIAIWLAIALLAVAIFAIWSSMASVDDLSRWRVYMEAMSEKVEILQRSSETKAVLPESDPDEDPVPKYPVACLKCGDHWDFFNRTPGFRIVYESGRESEWLKLTCETCGYVRHIPCAKPDQSY